MATPQPDDDRALSRADRAKQFFVELKRRKVYRVAVAYIVVAWVLIQVATQVSPYLEHPPRPVRLLIFAVVLGFPIAIILAWAYDITPTGIVRTEDAPAPVSPFVASPTVPEKKHRRSALRQSERRSRNRFFADGVHDDILSSLARIADLKVISRTSVQQYRTGDRNLREIGAASGSPTYLRERSGVPEIACG